MYIPSHVRTAVHRLHHTNFDPHDSQLQQLGFSEYSQGTTRGCCMDPQWVLKFRHDRRWSALYSEYSEIRSLRRSKYRAHVPYSRMIGHVMVQQRVHRLTDHQYLRHASAIHRLSDKLRIVDIGPGNVGMYNGKFIFFDIEARV